MTGTGKTRRRIPEIKQTCFLKGVLVPPLAEQVRVCVEYPVRSGIQPALLIDLRQTAASAIIDSIVILPKDLRYEPPTTDLHCNYLGLVAHASTRRLAKLRENPLLYSWRSEERVAFPFRSIALGDVLFELRKELRSGRSIQVARAMQSLRTSWARASRVALPHVHDAASAKAYPRDWWILDRWTDWEARRLAMYDRYVEFRSRFGGDEPNSVTTYKRIVNTFTKRCSTFLRLKFEAKKDRKRLKRLRLDWEAAFYSGPRFR